MACQATSLNIVVKLRCKEEELQKWSEKIAKPEIRRSNLKDNDVERSPLVYKKGKQREDGSQSESKFGERHKHHRANAIKIWIP